MLLSRNKMAISSLVAVLFIAGCEDSSNAFSYPQTETGLELTPFAHELVQGQTLTVDFATHVAGGDDWTLVDVVDPNGLVSIVEQGPTFVKIHGDYPGVTTLDWQVLSDGESYASVALIDVDPQTVAVNVAPETTPLMLAVDSDEPVNINLGDAVHDSDGDELTITEFVQTDNRFQQDGFDVVYRASGFVGQEIAYYTVDDGQGGSTIGTVSITVSDTNPVTPNTAPEASDIEKSLGQGERIQIDISPSVADADGDEVQLHKLAATSGRATIIDPNTIEYNAAQFSGQDSFIYVVKDNKGGFAQAEVKLDVAAAEVILPLATQPLTLAMSQGKSETFDISSSVSGDADWTLTSVVDSSGLVNVTNVTSPFFTLEALDGGVAELTYTVGSDDGQTASDRILVAINVTDNVPPTAQNVLANTDSETALAIDLNASIADADGGTVRVTGINQGDSTRFSLSGNIVNYEPNGFIGTDSAVYEVSDGQGGVALASIVINVDDANPLVLNNVPTASDYAQATASDTPVTIDLVTTGLIADADNDPLTVTVFSGQGRAVVDGTSIMYTPNGFVGSDEVVYQVSDGKGGTAIAMLLFTVSDATPNNTVPTAQGKTYTFSLSTALTAPEQTLNLSPLVDDTDGDELTLTNVVGAVNPVAINDDLSLTYTLSTAVTNDKFTYVISDGKGGFAQNEISVELTNTAPVANPVTVAVDPYSVTEPSVEINLADAISDADGDTLTLSSISDVALPATLSQNGLVLTYTPNGVEGTTSLHYSVTDGMDTSSSVVSIISASQGKLTANDFAVPAMAMDAQTITIDVASFVSNESGRDLVISGVVGAKLGSVNLITDTTQFTYTPNNISFGDETLTYAVTDNEGHYAYADIAISLEASVKPSITDLTLSEELGVMTATVTCNDCDLARTDYQYDIDGVPVGENSAHYTLVGDEKEHNIDVTVTAKNAYCTVNNTGVSGGNACKTTVGKVIVSSSYVKSVSGQRSAFAALLNNGGVVTWGSSVGGGDSESVQSQLTEITTIYSNDNAFAAIKNDGSVVTWGSADLGGDSSSVAGELTSIRSIASTSSAFAAVTDTGNVVTWGNWGGDSSAVQSELDNVKEVVGNRLTFAAIKFDGTVVTWGDEDYGGDSSAVQAELTDVKEIVGTNSSFAALKADGTVVTWGNSWNGGDSSSVQTELVDVVQISATKYGAFAALKADGTVVTWGPYSYGGNSSGVQSQLTNVIQISGTDASFSAVKSDGAVVTWGEDGRGGDASTDRTDLINMQSVTANGGAFAGLKDDGTVLVWGSDSYGTDAINSVNNPLPDDISDITSIVANYWAFVAFKADGTLVVWGNISGGGDSSTVDTELLPQMKNVFKDLSLK